MVLLDATTDITISQFWTIIGIIITFIGGVFTWALWVARKIASLSVMATDHHERLGVIEQDRKRERESQVLERNVMSKEFQDGQKRIYDKIEQFSTSSNQKFDTLTTLVTDVRIKCASHFPN